MFNQLEEISLNVYQKHLYLARADLQASGIFDLDKALEEYPGSFTNMFMDHRKARDGSVKRIYETAVGLCAKPWSHQRARISNQLGYLLHRHPTGLSSSRVLR